MKKQPSLERPYALSKSVFQDALSSVYYVFILFLLTGKTGTSLAQTSDSDLFLQAKELKLDYAKVKGFFSMKKGDETTFYNAAAKNEKASKQNLIVRIINHSNVGEKSGAIAATIALEKQEARLLMNRKERNGKVIYWMAILIPGSNEAFKLKEESKDGFILERTTKDQVVTE